MKQFNELEKLFSVFSNSKDALLFRLENTVNEHINHLNENEHMQILNGYKTAIAIAQHVEKY